MADVFFCCFCFVCPARLYYLVIQVTLSVCLVLWQTRWGGAYLDDDQMAILGYSEIVDCTQFSDVLNQLPALWTKDFWGIPLHLNISHKSWRPLTSLSFRAQWCIHGDNRFWLHAANTLLHVIVTSLFQLVCERVVFHERIVPRTRVRRSLAWIAAVLYGVHPIHVECVSNIVGRAEPLSAIFFLLAILAFRCVVLFSVPVLCLCVGIFLCNSMVAEV